MKKLAILIVLALELAVCGCGSSNNTSTETNTSSRKLGGPTHWGHAAGEPAELCRLFLRHQWRPARHYRILFHQCRGLFCEWPQRHNAKWECELHHGVDRSGERHSEFQCEFSQSAWQFADPDGYPDRNFERNNRYPRNPQQRTCLGTWTLTGGQGDPTCMGTGTLLMCQNPTAGACPTSPTT